MPAKILIVDDEDLIRWSLSEDLAAAGYKTVAAEDAPAAIAALERENPDAVLTDLRLGNGSGLDVLREAKKTRPGVPVILMTAFADFSSAVEALREGAADYISKPMQLAGLKITLQRVLETTALRNRLQHAHQKRCDLYNFDSIVAASPSMKDVVATARKIAASPYGAVLILGESGVGKDRLARAIHYESPRASQPLMEIGCSAIPETLLESELFGYEKGAFTGALQQKKGLLELAEGGTAFLNEIGQMPLGLQAKVLRALEDKTFKRVGGRDDITVDVRVVAATNEDIEDAVAKERFRSDLYYRINVLTIRLLPLRERREDILPLVDNLAEKLCRDINKPKPELPPETLAAMQAYAWPGNVRELRNVLERMMILGETGFEPPSAPQACGPVVSCDDGEGGLCALPAEGVRIEDVEKSLVRQALKRSGGNQQKAAQLLGLSRDALRRRMEKFGFKALTAALLALVLPLTGSAGLFGGKGKEAKDPFFAANAEKAKELQALPGAHAPVREGKCSKCHADPKDPAKLVLEYKPLCLSCHPSRVEDLKKANVHSAFNDGDCNLCHAAHASDNPKLLNAETKELCSGCHQIQEDPIKKAHHGVTAFEGSCTDCHTPHGSSEPKLIIEGRQHVPFRSRSCEMCHKKAGKDGKPGLKEMPAKSCFVCHSDFRNLGQSPVVHPPFDAGLCTACHNPHVSFRPALIRGPLSKACFGCHDEGLKNAHPVIGHPTEKEGMDDPRRKGKPFNCASCHNPHAGRLPKLLRGEISTLCGECHKK